MLRLSSLRATSQRKSVCTSVHIKVNISAYVANNNTAMVPRQRHSGKTVLNAINKPLPTNAVSKMANQGCGRLGNSGRSHQ